MKTDDLIKLLAAGDVTVAPNMAARRYAIGLGAGLLVATALMLALLGFRADMSHDTGNPMLWIKTAFIGWTALTAFAVMTQLARPGTALARGPALLGAGVAVLWIVAAIAIARAAPSEWPELVLGVSWDQCPVYIATLAVPVFVGALWALRGMAPTRPRLAGATAGLVAGAAGALVYSFHCPELTAPFLAVWYVLGMLALAPIGAWIGPRVLRW